jgi:signal transduction histidine kinase
MADGSRLKQILFNLLNNAIKFTESGEICVRAQWVEAAGEKPILRLQVRDTGIGISEADQDKVFTAFEQADGSITRRYGGTGLGLAIVRQFTEMMGGTISLQSEVGQGSTFTVELPLERCG